MMAENIEIKKLIKRLGTQKALAEALGVTQEMVHYYLHRELSAVAALKINMLFRVPLKKLRPDLCEKK